MVFIPYPPGTGPIPEAGLPEEMVMQRDLTYWFIEQDPTDIVLVPRSRVRVQSGAYQWTDGASRPVQRVKFSYGGNTGAGRSGLVDTGDGRERMFSYILIGLYNLQIEIADRFTDPAGQKWEIEELLPYNGYEVKASVRSYGGDPQYG